MRRRQTLVGGFTLERYRTPIIILMVLLILAGAAVLFYRWAAGDKPLEITLHKPTPAAAREIKAQVDGAVASPGVYSFYDGARVEDAVEAAGGFAPDADKGLVNLAAKIVDGDSIYVPQIGEAPQKINVNTAEAWLLEAALKGIGPARAQKIVVSREKEPFTRIEELTERKLIPDYVFEDIKDSITVR